MEQLSPTQLIRDDHKTMRGLFRQFEAVDLRAHEMKQGVVQQIFFEIKTHSEMEEEFFYPALQAALDDQSQKVLINEAQADHDAVENMMHELQSMDATDPRFNNKFGEMIEAVELHMSTEETSLLHLAETTFEQDTLMELGHRMNEARQNALDRAPHLIEKAQDPNGGEQMRRRGRAA